MNYQDLIYQLQKSVVTITYTHYRTKIEEKVRATLMLPSTRIGQHPDCDFIALWDVDNNEWKSIDKNTIVSYE
jgi:hypothetical protein